MNEPKDKFDKVKIFLERAIKLRMRVKYRDVMLKKKKQPMK